MRRSLQRLLGKSRIFLHARFATSFAGTNVRRPDASHPVKNLNPHTSKLMAANLQSHHSLLKHRSLLFIMAKKPRSQRRKKGSKLGEQEDGGGGAVEVDVELLSETHTVADDSISTFDTDFGESSLL